MLNLFYYTTGYRLSGRDRDYISGVF